MTSTTPGSEPVYDTATEPDPGLEPVSPEAAGPEAAGPEAAGPEAVSPETVSPETAAGVTPDPAIAPDTSAAAAPDDKADLEREIEQTREQLGETVEALAAKVDVGKRARDKVTQLKGKAGEAAQQARRTAVEKAGQGASVARQQRGPLVAGVLVAVTAALGFLAVRRWRKR